MDKRYVHEEDRRNEVAQLELGFRVAGALAMEAQGDEIVMFRIREAFQVANDRRKNKGRGY